MYITLLQSSFIRSFFLVVGIHPIPPQPPSRVQFDCPHCGTTFSRRTIGSDTCCLIYGDRWHHGELCLNMKGIIIIIIIIIRHYVPMSFACREKLLIDLYCKKMFVGYVVLVIKYIHEKSRLIKFVSTCRIRFVIILKHLFTNLYKS